MRLLDHALRNNYFREILTFLSYLQWNMYPEFHPCCLIWLSPLMPFLPSQLPFRIVHRCPVKKKSIFSISGFFFKLYLTSCLLLYTCYLLLTFHSESIVCSLLLPETQYLSFCLASLSLPWPEIQFYFHLLSFRKLQAGPIHSNPPVQSSFWYLNSVAS